MENEVSYQVIKEITNDCHEDRILGRGGFGTVYKADLDGKTIAVKVFDQQKFDDKEFRKEFDNLKRLKHENIVELLGFCNTTEEVVHTDENGKQTPALKLHTALCLEYVQNGHLGNYISDESKGLHWPERYKIIKGICNGLEYLHDHVNPPILHLDLKPENILLDQDMMPKVADFGLSRLFGEEKTRKTMTTNIGTIGYVPPEYTDLQVITKKFDIYSLGVIMVKTIAGRDRFFKIAYASRKEFINQVHDNWRKRLRQNLTSKSVEVYCHQVRRCIEIALDCVKKNGKERPTIQKIVSDLTDTETKIGNLGLNMEQFPQGESIQLAIGIPENILPEKKHDAIRSDAQEGTPSLPMELPFDFLKKITGNFSQELSQHALGTVYKGILDDGQVIAVVQFHPDSPVGRDRSFTTKARSLIMLNHENIVNILFYCRDRHNQLVQYNGRYIIAEITETLVCHEYFSAGNLVQYLHGSSSTRESCLINWNLSFKIIMGICQGLHFLHKELDKPFIHMDLKPENIFMDENMVTKILFFGQFNGTTPTGPARSSNGYMAPEYLYNGEISDRADIYSLGIIILEIISGQINHNIIDQKQGRRFIENVLENWTDGEYIRSMYQSLNECCIGHVKICIEMGLKCVEVDQRKRPCIENIVDMLNILSKEGQYYGMQEELVKYELLEVHPQELFFPFEPKKHISCSLQLRNKGDDHVAFMLVSETPNRYLKKLPLCGVVPHRCTYTHTITLRKQLQQKPGELFTLHTVAVGKYDLQDVDKSSIAMEYEKFFNKAKEGHGDEDVQVMTLTVNCDPAIQEPTRATVKIITTSYALEVSSIDVHPTEPWIMTVSKGSLHVWNYKTMETLVPFKEVTDDSVCVAKFIEREKWLVAGDANGGIHVYSYDEHAELELFDAHNSCITSLAFHPTCPFLLSSSEDEDNLIKLWDWDKNWQCTRKFSGHDDKVMQVIFNSKSMSTFTSASLDGTVKIWSVDKDDADITLDEKDGRLLCVDNFERYNVQHLIAGCMDGTAQIWNMEEGCVGKLEGHKDRITSVNLHPQLQLLITGSFDGTVRLWSTDTYKLEDIIDFNLGQVYTFEIIKDLGRIVVGCKLGIATMDIPMRI